MVFLHQREQAQSLVHHRGEKVRRHENAYALQWLPLSEVQCQPPPLARHVRGGAMQLNSKWTALGAMQPNSANGLRSSAHVQKNATYENDPESDIVRWKPLWLLPSEKCRPEVHPS